MATPSEHTAPAEEGDRGRRSSSRWRWPDWMGVGEKSWPAEPGQETRRAKTLWDWLQLLIVPAILIGVTFVWSYSQTRSANHRDDRRIDADGVVADEARRDATLQKYFDQMSSLVLGHQLVSSND